MRIELHQIAIRDLVKGYVDNKEEGVIAYSGKLNIRPPYLREFVPSCFSRGYRIN